MTSRRTLLTLTLTATAFALGLGDVALARRGGRDDRARQDLTAAANDPVAAREARIEVRRDGGSRQRVTLKLEDGNPGLRLDVFLANGAGDLVDVGDVVERRSGDYRWRIRSDKDAALPFGVADVSELAGRALEVRTADGALSVSGTFPVVAPRTVKGKSAKVRSSLAVDGDTAQSLDDSAGGAAVHAEFRARRKSNGREELKVEIEHLASGLSLTLWLADAAGDLTFVGDLVEHADDDGAEYEITYRSDEGGLPLDAASLADLAGRQVEIRTADGDVLASGTVPDAGSSDSVRHHDESGDDHTAGHDANDDNGTDAAGHDANDDNGTDAAGHDANDDNGTDAAGHDANDDNGTDAAGHDANDDNGTDAAGHDANDDNGTDAAGHDANDDNGTDAAGHDANDDNGTDATGTDDHHGGHGPDHA